MLLKPFVFLKGQEKSVWLAAAKREAELDKLATGFSKTDSGLRYQIIQKGDGKSAEKGKRFQHYKG